MVTTTAQRPGTDGEHLLQDLWHARPRGPFCPDQLLDTLTPRMVEFLGRQTQMIIATADPDGRPDAPVVDSVSPV